MLYKLDSDKESYKNVKMVTFKDINWKEENFENLLANNIKDFINTNELMIIFQERKRKEEPDLMALDKNGELYIFELKRWGSNQENILQVLRYGQIFGKSNYVELNNLFKKYTNKDAELFKEFENEFNIKIDIDKFNNRQHFIIVVNGIDIDTIEAIKYWRSIGLDCDAIVYYLYDINKEYFIEFKMYSNIDDYCFNNSNNFYILNTNFSNNPSCHNSMLDNKKAAAYYSPWKDKIKYLKKGDTVFLYKSKAGIVAYGKADGTVNKIDYENKHEEEYNMKLEQFHKLNRPLPANEIENKILGRRLIYMQTMFSIKDEDGSNIIKYIKENGL